MNVLGALLAYAGPVLFGLGAYVSISRDPKKIPAAAVAWATGWTTINLITFTANQFLGARLDAPLFWALSALLLSLGGGLCFFRRNRLRGLFRGPWLPDEMKKGQGLVVLLGVAGFLCLVFYKGLTIWPAATDAIVYHMQLAKTAVETGNLDVQAGVGWLDLATGFPNLLVTQQLWIYLGVGGYDEVFVRPIMPIYTSLLMLIVFYDARRWFGLVPATFALGGLVSLSEFSSLSIVLLAEIPVAFFSYLACRFAIDALHTQEASAAAGFFAGSAGLVKYNGLAIFAAIAITLFLVSIWPKKFLRSGVQHSTNMWRVGAFSAVGTAVVMPLLLRNWLELGNPVYPFLFGGVNTGQLSYYVDSYTPADFQLIRMFEIAAVLGTVLVATVILGFVRIREWSDAERLLFMFFLFFLPVYLWLQLRGSYIRYLAPVIPFLAILCGRQLAWWLFESDRRRSVLSGLLLGSLFVIVGAVEVSVRELPPYLLQSVTVFFLSAVLILLIVAAVRMAAAFPWVRKGQVTTFAAIGVLLILLIPGSAAVVAEQYAPRETSWDVTVFPLDRESYLSARFGDDWRMWQWMNSNLPSDVLVLTFETRLLYLEVNTLYGASSDMIPTYSMSFDEAFAYVKGLGAQYVLDSPWSHVPEINRIFWSRSVLFQNISSQDYFSPVHAEGTVVLYEIVDMP